MPGSLEAFSHSERMARRPPGAGAGLSSGGVPLPATAAGRGATVPSRPEMAPQTLEKAQFGNGNGAPTDRRARLEISIGGSRRPRRVARKWRRNPLESLETGSAYSGTR